MSCNYIYINFYYSSYENFKKFVILTGANEFFVHLR